MHFSLQQFIIIHISLVGIALFVSWRELARRNLFSLDHCWILGMGSILSLLLGKSVLLIDLWKSQQI